MSSHIYTYTLPIVHIFSTHSSLRLHNGSFLWNHISLIRQKSALASIFQSDQTLYQITGDFESPKIVNSPNSTKIVKFPKHPLYEGTISPYKYSQKLQPLVSILGPTAKYGMDSHTTERDDADTSNV